MEVASEGEVTGRTPEELMHKLFGEDVLPYFAGESGETRQGLVYEYWSLEGPPGQPSWGQSYLVQDYSRAKGGYFWVAAGGDPEVYESCEVDLDIEDEEDEEDEEYYPGLESELN
jgi:hypothetical protein